MEVDILEYAIVIEKVQAVLVMSSNFKSDQEFHDQKVELFRGSTVQVKGRQNSYTVVMICDFYQSNLAFQNNLYYVKTTALQVVDQSIWLQLVAIPDMNQRANITKDKAYVDYLSTLKIGSFVLVTSEYFSTCLIRQSLQFLPERDPTDESNRDYNCIIRYIGFIDEMGPGYFYGLELLVNFSLLPHHL